MGAVAAAVFVGVDSVFHFVIGTGGRGRFTDATTFLVWRCCVGVLSADEGREVGFVPVQSGISRG
jgi:hypothetical protein